jgi:hypothetical protein
MFIDVSFPTDEIALGAHVSDRITRWIRATSLFDPSEDSLMKGSNSANLFPINREPTPTDLIPKTSLDCAFVAACSSLCIRPDYLKSLFIAYNPFAGVCAVKFWSVIILNLLATY